MESGPFLEAQEAYTVLSDPVQRREYDHQVLRKTRRPWRPPAEPLVPPGPAPEPFAAAAPASIFLDHGFAREFYHASFDDSFDPLFDRLWSDSM
jgi:curved DNA-binding protein CbpA